MGWMEFWRLVVFRCMFEFWFSILVLEDIFVFVGGEDR